MWKTENFCTTETLIHMSSGGKKWSVKNVLFTLTVFWVINEPWPWLRVANNTIKTPVAAPLFDCLSCNKKAVTDQLADHLITTLCSILFTVILRTLSAIYDSKGVKSTVDHYSVSYKIQHEICGKKINRGFLFCLQETCHEKLETTFLFVDVYLRIGVSP